ncbi:hypothetical protein [Vagococcus xieshaowenii]|nr:hypothetical protein [Vagococcus xieshaowenii]
MKKKIEFILTIMPNVAKIIDHATEEQVDKLYQQAQEKFDYELEEGLY